MLSLMEAGGVGFLFALLVTPLWIRYLRRHSYGQQIREDGPSTHLHKAGTPTMGGVVIMLGALLGYLMGHVGTSITITRAGVLAMSVTLASGLLGFVDDLLAIRNARNLGLNKRGKFAGQ
ncbi:MAG: phospho-N-acetylmuramoyl-pentapeptide-transferase, partial [Acidobacteriota bacterium]|nr:phospho-N-acetylmuramoyl-pentapeptide-transferase [Acidobacteriota bacterium]